MKLLLSFSEIFCQKSFYGEVESKCSNSVSNKSQKCLKNKSFVMNLAVRLLAVSLSARKEDGKTEVNKGDAPKWEESCR